MGLWVSVSISLFLPRSSFPILSATAASIVLPTKHNKLTVCFPRTRNRVKRCERKMNGWLTHNEQKYKKKLNEKKEWKVCLREPAKKKVFRMKWTLDHCVSASFNRNWLHSFHCCCNWNGYLLILIGMHSFSDAKNNGTTRKKNGKTNKKQDKGIITNVRRTPNYL